MLVVGFLYQSSLQAVNSMIGEDDNSSLGLRCKGQPQVRSQHSKKKKTELNEDILRSQDQSKERPKGCPTRVEAIRT